jgi:hypothetical protein
MSRSSWKGAAALAAMLGMSMVPGKAQALNIMLKPDDSFIDQPNGAAALTAFAKAANYWNQAITTDVDLLFDVHFDDLGANTLGGTYTNAADARIATVYGQLAVTGNSAIDRAAVAGLRPLSAAGGLGYRLPGTDPATGKLTVNNAGSRYDNNDSYNNLYLNLATSVNKALGIGFDSSQTLFRLYNDYYNTNFDVRADADITFSSTFAFDFDPTDGIAIGTYDFTGVAIHEMGHALGFLSGTDDYEYNVIEYDPARALTPAQQDQYSWLSSLDLFRYGANNPAGADGRDLQLDPNRPAFFSLDGQLPFNFNDQLAEASSSFFSTGYNFGDGGQASHWQDANALLLNNGCFVDARQIGIMDPTASNCQNGIVTSNDLAAFDAMGWNVAVDVNHDRGYTFDTAQAFALPGMAVILGVPEPSAWALMAGGFGLAGFALRRRGGGRAIG